MRELKILVIVGSPRKYGNTSKLAELAAEGVRDVGAKPVKIYLVDFEIKPCIGCVSDDQLACRYPCIIEDGMRKIYKMILESEGLIIATPIYWYSPSGLVKNFIDRLTVFENMIYVTGRSWVEGKTAGVIAVGNDSGSIQTIASIQVTLNSMGFVIPPWSLAYFHRMGDVLEDDNACIDAYNVGRVVALMAKILRKEEIGGWYSNASEKNIEVRKKVGLIVKKYEDELIARKERFKRFKKTFSSYKREIESKES
ncbi:MAG: flavodoxin family protein [Thermoprotei archaeon]|nr:MAG: flavodoxin family protein [Thermoprotei archaeon]